ncbi:MAG: GGDEF domain-containing protein [Candidatus Mcinerneyibacterium aminivorans]|uniref:GGDEF domain-containing protein n=1 Tax=Candidatus Mcinerneyibacterium aminivorans TaxID=2703815 RepID=A0A5D0MJZ2_9BACT|nr:MAG: GGDEF domain-containing protein [Candidatus Mcinerneyibacterium aminivorans]
MLLYNNFITSDKNIDEVINYTSLTTGRLLSFIGIPILLYFTFQDLFIVEIPILIYSRLVTIITMSTFLVISFSNFKKKFKFIKIFHYLILLSLIMMVSNIVISIFSIHNIDKSIKLGTVDGLILILLISFLFSGYLKYYFWLVIIPQSYMYLMLIFYLNIDMQNLLLFVNPFIITILILLLYNYKRKLFLKQYFLMKKNLIQKEKLQSKVDKLEELNLKLNDLNEELEKEIKEKEILQRKLKKKANIDELTSLLNRRALFEVIQNIFKYNRKRIKVITICFIDVDKLKYINDNFGHKEGDIVLFKIGKILKEHVREKDYVGRIGGDEFLIYFENITKEKAENIMNRINDKIKKENKIISKNYQISISYGCVQYDEEKHNDLDDMIYAADRKMYTHKKGKNTR